MSNKSILFYKISSYGLIAFALLHSIGHFSDPTKDLDEEGKALWHSLQTYEIRVTGLTRTFMDFLVGYSCTSLSLLSSS